MNCLPKGMKIVSYRMNGRYGYSWVNNNNGYYHDVNDQPSHVHFYNGIVIERGWSFNRNGIDEGKPILISYKDDGSIESMAFIKQRKNLTLEDIHSDYKEDFKRLYKEDIEL